MATPYVVRSLAFGVWRSFDLFDSGGRKDGTRQLVKVLEHGTWSVDHKPCPVQPGLVVSFADESDAMYFIGARRGAPVQVEAGSLEAFAAEEDALHFVRHKLGVMLTVAEVDAMATHASSAPATPRK